MSFKEYFAEYGGMEFPFPEIAGTYTGTLVICGDAACVWGDVEKAGFRCDDGRGSVAGADFMAVNKLGEVFPGVLEHWYSNEAKLLKNFVAARRNEYEFGPPGNIHSCNRGVQWVWPWPGFGTSGLGACLTGAALGYDEIIVCGMPLDDSPHNGEPPWRRSNFMREVSDTVKGNRNRVWRHALETVLQNVTFMSGRMAR